MTTYHVGEVARLYADFTVSATSAATDPTGVTLQVRDAGGVLHTYVYGVAPIVRTALGSYHYDVGPFASGDAGTWTYAWVGAGAAEAGTGVQSFRVDGATP